MSFSVGSGEPAGSFTVISAPLMTPAMFFTVAPVTSASVPTPSGTSVRVTFILTGTLFLTYPVS